LKTDTEVTAYLDTVSSILTHVTGNSVLALYATGSLAFDDFARSRSDIDLLGVTRRPLRKSQIEMIQRELDDNRLPCPAKGLDFALLTVEVAASPARVPRVDFAMSTGHTWKLEIECGEEDGEFVLHCAICRQSAFPLIGPAPESVFGPMPRQWVLEELDTVLHWHADMALHPYHDPLGQFSILNACRAWYFVEHNCFCSKTEGGRWLLSRDPTHELVQTALGNRSGRTSRSPERRAIQSFLQQVRDIVGDAMSTLPARAADAGCAG